MCNAIANTAREVRGDLLKLARRMKDSPLADAGVDDVALMDGKIVSKRDANRAVSIASAMLSDNAERITREETNKVAEDKSHARNVALGHLRGGQGG